MDFSHQTILDKYGVPGTGTEYWKYVDMMKQYFIDHGLTMKKPLCSGGDCYIEYDCNGNF